jgi:Gnt-I system high-affinity gluconate transporter
MTLVIIFICILLQVLLTTKKVSPFLSLMIVAIIAGLLLGMPTTDILASIKKGVGDTLGGIVLIICLGAALGKILEVSGAAERISTTLIDLFGMDNIQWAVMLTGFLIGIPLYYNAGFVILVPLVFTLARKTGLPLLYIAIPMAASLSTTHCFLPPHPGPVVLVNAFKADMGRTLLYGILVAIPAVIVAGPFLGRYLKKIVVEDNPLFGSVDSKNFTTLPNNASSFLIALLPIILITGSVLANSFLDEASGLRKGIAFIGDSNIALLISVIVGLLYFGVRNNVSMDTQAKWVHDAISGIAVIILIITAGGVFKQIITDSGTAKYISEFSTKFEMPPLIFAWVITAFLRVTIGSATVAGITSAGVVAPLIATTGVSPELLALSVGAGSVFGSHINDSGFWMFKEYFNLSLKQTFQSWTLMESVISVMGLIGILILDLFV